MVATDNAICVPGNHDYKLLRHLKGQKVTINHGLDKTLAELQAVAALEVMSRFAADPKWLIYLPPTMSPVETSKAPGYLEHPAEAFAYYRKQGISQVICEEKHMGSRAVVIICKSPAAAKQRFGVTDGRFGICYTRTGRPFFDNIRLETEFLDRIRYTLTDFWAEFHTDWVCLDCELMPWSVKAQQLLKQQYAPVGCAAKVGLDDAISLLERAQARGIDVPLADYQARSQLVQQYTAAYRHYCWKVASIADLKLAPFHILATAGAVHTDKSHPWHLEQIAKLAKLDPELILATAHLTVDTTNPESVATGIDWWIDRTNQGSEGMVVKPIEYIPPQSIQPAIKCRGQEYLRIIYGAEYSLPEHLDRLRQRGLSGKRSLALREFALGIESLDRFVAKEPLRRVHECTFGVLALESEPIDPRL